MRARSSSTARSSDPPRPLPPYGVELEARRRWGNAPPAVLVLLGRDAWTRAKHPNCTAGGWARLLLPEGADPSAFRWPVSGLTAIVERGDGPTDELVVALVRSLLRDGAGLVPIIRTDWADGAIAYDRRGRRIDYSPQDVAKALDAGRPR